MTKDHHSTKVTNCLLYTSTARIRRDFLIEKIFVPNEVNMVYSMYDRMVVGGALPVGEVLTLEAIDPLKAPFFLTRREKMCIRDRQVKDFVLHRERTSIFDSSTAADVRYLLVLVVQTCVLTGIVFFNYFHDTCPMLMTKVSPLLLLGIYVGFCLAYFLLKWLLYMFLGWVFFDKNKTNMWLESYSTLIYYVGFALFPFCLLYTSYTFEFSPFNAHSSCCFY